jgi:hypothetical protein
VPVTIGKLTSNVNVVDAPGAVSNDLLERLVQTVMSRLKQELEIEARYRRELEVPDRVSDSDRF